ncbi:hypothetical protein HMP0721_2321 [Pseudoramibacter alactolyticus ATCC 23263]|uniref:Uncharacterized protein n=1 Tax=Pseudoramibacter alactolyticus ATCC 23263 TaxID=887929 RepID=E6MJY6_9FIRM|nr:hypothetical protein HMP0721_2321 [Pseudoramibacter alactolyticus ATCC 23263]
MAWLWNKHVNEIPDFIINEEIHQKISCGLFGGSLFLRDIVSRSVFLTQCD